jgi:hypothetical protein
MLQDALTPGDRTCLLKRIIPPATSATRWADSRSPPAVTPMPTSMVAGAIGGIEVSLDREGLRRIFTSTVACMGPGSLGASIGTQVVFSASMATDLEMGPWRR